MKLLCREGAAEKFVEVLMTAMPEENKCDLDQVLFLSVLPELDDEDNILQSPLKLTSEVSEKNLKQFLREIEVARVVSANVKPPNTESFFSMFTYIQELLKRAYQKFQNFFDQF